MMVLCGESESESIRTNAYANPTWSRNVRKDGSEEDVNSALFLSQCPLLEWFTISALLLKTQIIYSNEFSILRPSYSSIPSCRHMSCHSLCSSILSHYPLTPMRSTISLLDATAELLLNMTLLDPAYVCCLCWWRVVVQSRGKSFSFALNFT